MDLLPPPPLKPLELGRQTFPAVPTANRLPFDLTGAAYRQPRGGPIANAAVHPAILAKSLQTPAAQHEKLVQQTRQWVGQTFFGTLMKQMRESPFRSDLFEGGRGGQAFSSLYDQRMVEQMLRGAGNKLVNAIVRKLEARTAYGKQAKQNKRGAGGEPNVARELNPYQNVRVHVSPALGS